MKSKLTPPQLSVSIVLYHSPVELLRETLSSLYKACLYALESENLAKVTVVLVDNSMSQDYGSQVCEVVSELEPGSFFSLYYEAAGHNGGFGAGHNKVLPRVDSECHLILNPDVNVSETAIAAGLLELQENPAVTLVSPKVLSPSGAQEFLCKAYPSVLVLLLRAFAPTFVRRWFRPILHKYELRTLSGKNESAEVPLASGCFMLVRTSALHEVGGFNPEYFLYFEDFDLSLRLRGEIFYVPAVQIIHHGGYAAGKGREHIWLFTKSGFRFFNDHGWKWI